MKKIVIISSILFISFIIFHSSAFEQSEKELKLLNDDSGNFALCWYNKEFIEQIIMVQSESKTPSDAIKNSKGLVVAQYERGKLVLRNAENEVFVFQVDTINSSKEIGLINKSVISKNTYQVIGIAKMNGRYTLLQNQELDLPSRIVGF